MGGGGMGVVYEAEDLRLAAGGFEVSARTNWRRTRKRWSGSGARRGQRPR